MRTDGEAAHQQGGYSVAFYHIQRLKKVRSVPGIEVTAACLMSALVLHRLDYCNTVFANLAASTTAPLRRAQNAAASKVSSVREIT